MLCHVNHSKTIKSFQWPRPKGIAIIHMNLYVAHNNMPCYIIVAYFMFVVCSLLFVICLLFAVCWFAAFRALQGGYSLYDNFFLCQIFLFLFYFSVWFFFWWTFLFYIIKPHEQTESGDQTRSNSTIR